MELSLLWQRCLRLSSRGGARRGWRFRIWRPPAALSKLLAQAFQPVGRYAA